MGVGRPVTKVCSGLGKRPGSFGPGFDGSAAERSELIQKIFREWNCQATLVQPRSHESSDRSDPVQE